MYPVADFAVHVFEIRSKTWNKSQIAGAGIISGAQRIYLPTRASLEALRDIVSW
jgi:hypothetical protein